MVVDYLYYTGVFLGTAVSEADWTRASREALQYVEVHTYGRLHGLAELPENVRLAVCAVAEVCAAQHAAAEKRTAAAGVKTFSNDGYSETLADAVQLDADFVRQKAEALDTYLPRAHPLRYAGA